MVEGESMMGNNNKRMYLVDHVTFWMPTFVSHVAIYFHKLFEDGAGAAGAFCSEAGRVVEMAVYVAVVFIVGILWAK